MDFSYLESVVGGDVSIALEVLALFRGQAPKWLAGLDAADAEWRATAHTVKGAARGIGAVALGDAAHEAEFGGPEDLDAVRSALDEVLAAIAAYEAEKAAA